MLIKTPKILSLIFILAICVAANSFAQVRPSDELGTEIQTLGGIGGRSGSLRCYPTSNLVVTKKEFEKLLSDKNCSLLKTFEVDFSKHTLINYSIGGDCFMRVKSRIFRNDKTKTYTVEAENFWGKCRAGGSYSSWHVIDKIQDGYKIELKEIRIENLQENEKRGFGLLFTKKLPKSPSIKYFQTKEIDLNGCIPMYRQTHFVIQDKESYLREIRKDAQTNRCKANVEKLDFQEYSYVGVLLRSGYCRYPKGLKHGISKNKSKKQYILDISYDDPEGRVCRALSRYELWLRVPKLQKDFDLIFQVGPRPGNG